MLGHEAWRNATNMPTVTLLESVDIEAIPTSAYGRLDIPQTFRIARLSTGANQSDSNVTRSQEPKTVMSPSFVPIPTSSSSPFSDISRSMDSETDVMARYMYNVAADFRNIIAAHLGGNVTEQCNDLKVDSGKASSSGNTSTKPTKVSANISIAVIDLPHGSIVFLNTTTPKYLLIDHANATIAVWTEPVNTSTIATQARSHQILDKINTALPYIEASGLLAIVWEIGKFVHARVHAYRRRSRCLSMAEELQ
jgi:hypothetical protein